MEPSKKVRNDFVLRSPKKRKLFLTLRCRAKLTDSFGNEEPEECVLMFQKVKKKNGGPILICEASRSTESCRLASPSAHWLEIEIMWKCIIQWSVNPSMKMTLPSPPTRPPSRSYIKIKTTTTATAAAVGSTGKPKWPKSFKTGLLSLEINQIQCDRMDSRKKRNVCHLDAC